MAYSFLLRTKAPPTLNEREVFIPPRLFHVEQLHPNFSLAVFPPALGVFSIILQISQRALLWGMFHVEHFAVEHSKRKVELSAHSKESDFFLT